MISKNFIKQKCNYWHLTTSVSLGLRSKKNLYVFKVWFTKAMIFLLIMVDTHIKNIALSIKSIQWFLDVTHYVRRPSSLAWLKRVESFLKLNQQHFGWEDPWHWNLDGQRWSWMVFRPWHSQFLRVFLFKLDQIW